MALKMTVSEYVSAQRAYGSDSSKFIGYVFDKYFELTGDLNQTETNDYLEQLMDETKLDVFSNSIFVSEVYAITFTDATSSISGVGLSDVSKFFPTALEMSKVIDSIKAKARMNYGDIFEMSLIQFSVVAQSVGLIPTSNVSELWFRHYQNNLIGNSRSFGNTFYQFFDIVKISSLLELYNFNIKSNQDLFAGFVGLSYDTTSGALSVSAFNDMMREFYSLNRLGIWGDDIDVSIDINGDFQGTDFAAFRSRIIGQKTISSLVNLLISLRGGSFDDVSKLDFATAVNIFENNYLDLK